MTVFIVGWDDHHASLATAVVKAKALAKQSGETVSVFGHDTDTGEAWEAVLVLPNGQEASA